MQIRFKEGNHLTFFKIPMLSRDGAAALIDCAFPVEIKQRMLQGVCYRREE